jgi:hypothetical protein
LKLVVTFSWERDAYQDVIGDKPVTVFPDLLVSSLEDHVFPNCGVIIHLNDYGYCLSLLEIHSIVLPIMIFLDGLGFNKDKLR